MTIIPITEAQADAFQTWFEAYTAPFLKIDKPEFMIDLKYHHCHRVSGIALELAIDSAWSNSDVTLAGVLGLAHDVGRFRQWQVYQSFEDKATEDHGELGKKVLEEESPVREWPTPLRDLILRVVQIHNDRFIPDDMQGTTRRCAGLLRDSDKLDALDLFTNALTSNQIEEQPAFCWGRSWSGTVNDAILKEVESDRLAKNTDIQSIEDFLLGMMSWTFDFQLKATRHRVRQKKYLQILARGLPASHRVAQATERIFEALQRP